MTQVGEKVAAAVVKKEAEKKGNLKVKVVDRCNGNAVEDAGVRVGRQEQNTGAPGTATFSDLPVGSHSVRVEKRFPDEDYLKFIIHSPKKLTFTRKAESKNTTVGDVEDKQTTEIEVEIDVYRPVEKAIFKRKHIALTGDQFGHWWVELDDTESYGWWPKYRIGSDENQGPEPDKPDPLPADAGRMQRIGHRFAMAVYSVRRAVYDSGLARMVGQTFGGVEGELNGQTSFSGTPNKDPHHGDPGADEKFQPVIHDCRTDVEIKQCIRDFAAAYSGEWSWKFEFGKNCHSFQLEMIDNCDIGDLKEV
jgi:hypothetical protein